MSKLILANWKSNPKTLTEAVRLAKGSDAKNVVIAPSHPHLERVRRVLKHARLASQDVSSKDGGPYTGEVSPSQLKNLGVRYVIVGHSERRRLGETDELISKKVKAAFAAGLKVVLCVGENTSTRRKGIAASKRFIAIQLKKDLTGIRKQELGSRNLIVAYEPVWAIGTGKSDKPKDSAQMITHIKKLLTSRFQILDSRVLYGGSVTSKNARSFLSHPKIDGVLVGGASLKVKSFKAIIRS